MISYTAARKNIISRLKEVSSGLNLSLHTLRQCGATGAVSLSVNERCIKRHGRLKCNSSKEVYVVDQLENRQAVSKELDSPFTVFYFPKDSSHYKTIQFFVNRGPQFVENRVSFPEC